MSNGKSMYYSPPRHKKYGEIVDMDTPSAARGSVSRLKKEFNDAKTRDKKVRVMRVTQLASNRAEGAQNRKNLSEKERKQFKKIEKIYGEAANDMQKKIPDKPSKKRGGLKKSYS